MAADEREQDSALRDLSQLNEVVQNLVRRDETASAEAKEKFENLSSAVMEIQKTLQTIATNRRGEFSTEDADPERISSENKGNIEMTRKALDTLVTVKTRDDEIVEAQRVLDHSAILATLTGVRPLQTRYFQIAVRGNKYLQKVLNIANVGNVGVGGALTGWQPAQFTQRMIERIRLARIVPTLHSTFNMPADPYRFPLEGPGATVKVVSEQADADAEVTEAKKVPTGFTDTGADHLVMSSKKWGLRVVLSNELEEDSYIPIIDYIEDQIVKAVSDFRENVTINGAVDSSLDSSITYTGGNQLTAFSGYRKALATVATARVTNGAFSGNTDFKKVDIADFRGVRSGMGKHGGLNPRDIVWVTGPLGYFKLLAMKDGSNPSPVLTVDKYGPAATIISGELGQIDGSSVIMTEFMGPTGFVETLGATGLADGTTTVYTEILAVKPSAFTYGSRRPPSLRGKEIIDTDQVALILLERGTFFNYYPTSPVVGGLVKIEK